MDVRGLTARTAATRTAAVLASFLALATSGCALSAGSGSSAESARESLYATLDQTEQLLGGTWDNQDDPTSRGCVIPLWVEGEMFPALRVGAAPLRADVAVETVSDYWRDLELDLSTTDVGDVLELKGEGEFGDVLILRVSAEAMTLQGESECRPES